MSKSTRQNVHFATLPKTFQAIDLPYNHSKTFLKTVANAR